MNADLPDPQLVSYHVSLFSDWPCICGRPSVFRFWHRLSAGHWPNRAVKVSAGGHLVAQDGQIGAHYKKQKLL